VNGRRTQDVAAQIATVHLKIEVACKRVKSMKQCAISLSDWGFVALPKRDQALSAALRGSRTNQRVRSQSDTGILHGNQAA